MPDRAALAAMAKDGPIDAYLGLDVGSISTKVAVIDRENRVLAKVYLMTAGRPLEAVRKALSEIHRILKSGGRFHFLEHGRSDDPQVAKWQDRLNRFQKLVAGGCHLNRRIDQLVDASGLETRLLENFYMKGPRIGTFMYSGIAVKNHSG